MHSRTCSKGWPTARSAMSFCYLLAAVAAFRGRSDLASALQNLDAIQEACPECGTVVFPDELQQIHTRDAELR